METAKYINIPFSIFREEQLLLENTTLEIEIAKIKTGERYYEPLNQLILILVNHIATTQSINDHLIQKAIRNEILEELKSIYGDTLLSELDMCCGFFAMIDGIADSGRVMGMDGQVKSLEDITGTKALDPSTLGQDGFMEELLNTMGDNPTDDDDQFNLNQYLK
jgi:hypothetical protein